MIRRFIPALAVLPMLVFAAGAAADADTSLGVRAGTLGGGLELSHALSPHAGVRLNVDAYNRSGSSSRDNVDYDYKLKLRTGGVTGDWYPFANNFRISLGALLNGNKLTLHGKPSGATYTINGTTYTSAQVGSLDGDVDFNTVAPYLGLGYGRPINRGLSVIFDAGVLYQGSPKSKLTATCGPAIAGTALCTQLQNDATAEQSRLDDSLKNYKYYPVLSLGLAYTF